MSILVEVIAVIVNRDIPETTAKQVFLDLVASYELPQSHGLLTFR